MLTCFELKDKVSGLESSQDDLVLLMRRSVEFCPLYFAFFWFFSNCLKSYCLLLSMHFRAGNKSAWPCFTFEKVRQILTAISTLDFESFSFFSNYLKSHCLLLFMYLRAGNKSVWPRLSLEKVRQILTPILLGGKFDAIFQQQNDLFPARKYLKINWQMRLRQLRRIRKRQNVGQK